MSNIYEFQQNALKVVFGDFNARIEENEDFIVGVDTLPLREMKDFQTNQHCNSFINFLISTKCILNGRKSKNNDFTCISSRGAP